MNDVLLLPLLLLLLLSSAAVTSSSSSLLSMLLSSLFVYVEYAFLDISMFNSLVLLYTIDGSKGSLHEIRLC